VADGIDALVDPVEAPGLGATLNRLGAQTENDELRKGDHPVLLFRKGGDRPLQLTSPSASGRFHTYSGRNRPLASHGAMVPPLASRFSTRG
jgi:hypothetical protein